MRTEVADDLDQRHRRDRERLDGEAVGRERRQRVALREPGVDEPEPVVFDTEDLGSTGHLRDPDVVDVLQDLGTVHRRVQDRTALAAGAGDDEYLSALPYVPGHRRRTLAGLVIRVCVHSE